MRDAEKKPDRFFIGWDVGGWNCDRNAKSRDALVILDGQRQLIGEPWRGNLRVTINEAQGTDEWIHGMFALCKTTADDDARVTLAIDTPLGFSEAFLGLVTAGRTIEALGSSETNPYLYRQTERFLFERGLGPLSAIKDMIGSQATKGMHVLSKFAPRRAGCGVWSDGRRLAAIEAYPSACKKSASLLAWQQGYPSLGHDDLDDALLCALLAFLFERHRDRLALPEGNPPLTEGWIWVPEDALRPRTMRTPTA